MRQHPEQLLSVTQAAAVAGIAPSTIYHLCHDNLIPYTKIGSQVVISNTVAERLRELRARPAGCVSVTEAMEIAGVTRARIHQLLNTDRVKGSRRRVMGLTQVWVEKESLEEWMKGREK